LHDLSPIFYLEWETVSFYWMKSRDIRGFNLRAFDQQLLGVSVFLLTPRICLGAASKPKSRASRQILVIA